MLKRPSKTIIALSFRARNALNKYNFDINTEFYRRMNNFIMAHRPQISNVFMLTSITTENVNFLEDHIAHFPVFFCL